MKKIPECDSCGDDLVNWVGNVMILNSDLATNRISKITTWCKPCSRSHIEKGQSSDHHNLWELEDLKDKYIYYLGNVILGLTDGPQRWSKEAAEKYWSLGALAFPHLAGNPMGASFDPVPDYHVDDEAE